LAWGLRKADPKRLRVMRRSFAKQAMQPSGSNASRLFKSSRRFDRSQRKSLCSRRILFARFGPPGGWIVGRQPFQQIKESFPTGDTRLDGKSPEPLP
jgi:hypothetical protein